jgi:hypothetical protein
VYPAEPRCYEQELKSPNRWISQPILRELRAKAKRKGLWIFPMDREIDGTGLSAGGRRFVDIDLDAHPGRSWTLGGPRRKRNLSQVCADREVSNSQPVRRVRGEPPPTQPGRLGVFFPAERIQRVAAFPAQLCDHQWEASSRHGFYAALIRV